MARITGMSLAFVASMSGGCDTKSSAPRATNVATPRVMDERNVAMRVLRPFSESDGVRSACQRTGVEIPALSTLMRRAGRELPGFRVNADQAVDTWERLRAATDATGWYPLIVREEYCVAFGDDGPNTNVEQTLQAADTVDLT
jgi:hypothetical protein